MPYCERNPTEYDRVTFVNVASIDYDDQQFLLNLKAGFDAIAKDAGVSVTMAHVIKQVVAKLRTSN